jgi:parallel beta-helix repeat protein
MLFLRLNYVGLGERKLLKRIISGIMLILLLVSVLTWAFNVQLVESSGTIYIRADGGIDPPSANITSVDNVTYTFTGDNYDSVVIERANIVVDGVGYAVQGTGSGNGIYVSSRSNVTVKNMTVKGFSMGIYFSSSGGGMVSANNVTNNGYGVFLAFSGGSTVSGNNVTNNGYGIYLGYNSGGSTVSGNNVTNNGSGIHLYNSGGSMVTGNVMSGNGYNFGVTGDHPLGPHFDNVVTNNFADGRPVYYVKWASNAVYDSSTNAATIYLINSINVTVRDLTLTNNFHGVFLLNTTNSRIENVTATNNGIGIYLYDSGGSTVSGNNVKNNPQGITLIGSGGGTVLTNNVTNSNTGILILSSGGSIIKGNNVTNNGYGISLSYSGGSTVSGNTVNNNKRWGISLGYSDGSVVSDNNVNYNTEAPWESYGGILISSSSGSIIKGNNVTNNSPFGIWLWSSSNNFIYHNNFINNTNQVSSSQSNNTWDNGYPSGGNYWSNYIGVDNYSGPYQNETGSDGIGDSPYVIDVYNKDNYPILTRGPWIHDIAILNITLSATEAYAGQTVQISVVAKNWGNRYENFSVTVYYDNTSIGTQEVFLLAPDAKTILAFGWNTTDVAGGYYTISANASIVPEETNTTNNILTDGTVKITSPVRIVAVTPCNQTGYPKDAFDLGTMAYFKVTINSTALIPQDTLITINLYDNSSITIGVVSIQGPTWPGISTIIFGLPLPSTATTGTATIYANAYTDWPSQGGFPHCPEMSATLEITGP